jgi:hypothetical protein
MRSEKRKSWSRDFGHSEINLKKPFLKYVLFTGCQKSVVVHNCYVQHEIFGEKLGISRREIKLVRERAAKCL